MRDKKQKSHSQGNGEIRNILSQKNLGWRKHLRRTLFSSWKVKGGEERSASRLAGLCYCNLTIMIVMVLVSSLNYLKELKGLEKTQKKIN